jgi:hypothetical protein
MVMSDGVAQLLLGTASLPPGIGRGLAASSLVAYSTAKLSNTLVVYLVMSLSVVPQGHGCVLPCHCAYPDMGSVHDI